MKRFAFCLVFVLAAAPTFAQKLLGAEEVLRRMAGDSKTGVPAEGLRADINKFAGEMKRLPPSEAGSRWVGLAVQASKVANDPMIVRQVMGVLPPPESWPAIAKKAEELAKVGKPTTFLISLRMLGHTLVRDLPGQWKDIEALRAIPEGIDTEELYQKLATETGDTTRLLKSLDRQMQPKAGTDEDPAYQQQRTIVVPDLLVAFGEAKATEILTHLLKTSPIPLMVSGGERMTTLARTVAEKLLPQIKSPQYLLTSSLEGGKLYEGLKLRFPKAKLAPSQVAIPRAYAVLRAIFAGKGDTMMAQSDLLSSIYSLGGVVAGKNGPTRAKQLADFLHVALSARPNSSLWNNYVHMSLMSEQAPRAIADMRAALAKPTVKSEMKAQIRLALVDTLLGVDKVEEALALMRKETVTLGDDMGTKIAKLGFALNRPELVEEGLALKKGQSGEGYMRSGDTSIPELEIRLGRFEDAEKHLAETFVQFNQAPEAVGAYGVGWMQVFVQLYGAAGRPEDIVTLLDRSPYWGATDLVDLLPTFTPMISYSEAKPSIGPVLANALAKTGHKEAAIKLVDLLLDSDDSYDPTFALLLELKGDAAMAQLDAMAARNRYQERPLIWKAKLLLNQKKLDEAEATIRRAIAIDPSDGETKGGHRMYAYTVLSEILDAQGKKEDAEVFRSAVRAIRQSEQADALLEAGLVARAVKLYAESLKIFADAYCIQSRLAVQLVSEGRYEEAEEHYRRAFELMPDSFGEMESHCFGCEGVFTTGPAEGIAERVFEELVKKTPNKPQIHYLLGYLREEQGRSDEAFVHFKRATELDPEYINAWLHMRAATSNPAEIEKIDANLLRLDPLGKLGKSQEYAGDLAALYRAAAAALPPIQPRVPIYPLTFSKASGSEPYDRWQYYYGTSPSNSPGESLLRASIVQTLVTGMTNTASMMRRGF